MLSPETEVRGSGQTTSLRKSLVPTVQYRDHDRVTSSSTSCFHEIMINHAFGVIKLSQDGYSR